MPARTTRLHGCRWFVAAICACAFAGAAWAGGRPADSTRSWFGNIYTGWAFPEGDASDFLDDDWTLGGGVLFWPSDWPIGIEAEVSYVRFDFSGEAIAAINDAIDADPANDGQVDDGDIESWEFVLNGIWGPGNPGNGFYVSGGVGVYWLDATLTQTGLVYYPPICDPWYWWWCYPGGVGPGSFVVGDESTTEFGWNVGLGYDFPAGDGTLFIEAKYQYITTDSDDLYYIPVTIGFRW
jgi:hypothetical protein